MGKAADTAATLARQLARAHKERVRSPKATGFEARWAFRGRSMLTRAYPQGIVTTRLLYPLQDPVRRLSRLQRNYPHAL